MAKIKKTTKIVTEKYMDTQNRVVKVQSKKQNVA
jgi:hypothetical protein